MLRILPIHFAVWGRSWSDHVTFLASCRLSKLRARAPESLRRCPERPERPVRDVLEGVVTLNRALNANLDATWGAIIIILRGLAAIFGKIAEV